MSKKNILVQVFAVYLTINGSVSAAPPGLGPVPVETVPGNPLEVTVVGSAAPAVKILAQGRTSCVVETESCRTTLMLNFPEGTDTLVFQQLSVKMENANGAIVANNSYFIDVLSAETDLNRFIFYGTVAQSIGDFSGDPTFADNAIVNFVVLKEDVEPVEVKFVAGPFLTGRDDFQIMSWSGYYTKR